MNQGERNENPSAPKHISLFYLFREFEKAIAVAKIV